MNQFKMMALLGAGTLVLASMAFGQACLPDANGDGHPLFGGMITVPISPMPGTSGMQPVTSIVSGDLNGDGRPDVVMTHQTSGPIVIGYGSLSVHLNEGDGVMSAAQSIWLGQSTPRSAALGDLDGDGDLDLAFTDEANDAVRIYRNDGTGQFTAFGSFSVGDEPSSVVIADLDGDGDRDLAVLARLGDVVTVFRNNGNATFGSGVAYNAGSVTDSMPCYVSGYIYQRTGPRMAAADMNGDGRLDLVVPGIGGVSILHNTGPAAFQAPLAVPMPTGGLPIWSISAGNVNGDGRPDLVVSTGCPAKLVVSLNLSGGSWEHTAYDVRFLEAISPGTNYTVVNTALGDLDGDDDLDVVVGHAYFTFNQMLFNDGTGHFGPTPPAFRWFDMGAAVDGGPILLDDFDGDGRPDWAMGKQAAGPGVLRIALNDGTGQGHIFRTHERVPDLLNFYLTSVAVYPWVRPKSVAIADVDGDGRKDLIAFDNGVRNQIIAPRVIVVHNPGGGTFAGAQTDVYECPHPPPPSGTVTSPGRDGARVLAADMNHDGHTDLVVTDPCASVVVAGDPNYVDQYSGIRVFLNNGAGGFTNQTRYDTTEPGGAQQGNYGTMDLALGDVNGDGNVDVVAVNASWGWQTYYEPQYGIPPPDAPSRVRVFLNNGAGALTLAPGYPIDVGYNLRNPQVALADLDGDLDPDLMVNTGGESGVKIFFNNGSGGFTQVQAITPYRVSDSAALIDINHDGRLDLLVHWWRNATVGNPEAPNFAVYLNNGAGGFPTRMDLNVGMEMNRFLAADINGDGRDDLLAVADPDNVQAVGVLLDVAFPSYSVGLYSTEDPPTSLAAGDLDGDGKPEIVTTSMYPNLSILRQGCPKPPPPPCPADITGNGTVNIDDLVQVITNWGPCPIGPPPSPLRPAALGGPGSGPGSGDMNCDFVTDVHDIAPFMLALNDWKQYIEDYPDCDLFNGDMNNSGFPIDQADLAIFCPLAGGVISGQQCGIALPCPADINDDHVVNIDDLVQVITSWGACD